MIVAEARQPLSVAQAKQAGPFEKILLAVDKSSRTAKAISTAAEMARECNAEVVAFHVREVEPLTGLVIPVTEPDSDWLAKTVVDRLRQQGVNARAETVGPLTGVARSILDEAQSLGADLIVMGSRGPTEVGALMFGSVAHQVLHGADLPVLIVR